jgi:hypothetical protein
LRSCLDSDGLLTGGCARVSPLAGLCFFREEAVLAWLEDPSTSGFRFRGLGVVVEGGLWESQRQRRAAVTSATASLHFSVDAVIIVH